MDIALGLDDKSTIFMIKYGGINRDLQRMVTTIIAIDQNMHRAFYLNIVLIAGTEKEGKADQQQRSG
ncbi:hypothetical protein D3C81_2140970 [compost metagenome]